MDEAQATIKIAGRNINNLRYSDDTTLTAESKGTEKPLDESKRGELKSWLKTQHSKTCGSIISWKTDWETMETLTYFLGLQNHCRW